MKTLSLLASHGRLIALAVAALVCGLIAYQVDATVGTKIKFTNLKGLVTDSHDRPVVGATVYLVDASTVNTTPITPPAILNGVATAYDEPLEDITSNANLAKTLPQAKTNKKGQFMVRKLNAAAKYFAFVVPAATDTDHLPGGDASRIAFAPKAIDRKGLHIRVSWNFPSGATYIGTSACYTCHGAGSLADVTSNKHHGHALMFHRPGQGTSGNPIQDTANQDSAGHPGSSWNQLAQKFTLATSHKASGVKVLYFQEFNPNSSTNNGNTFAVYEDTPGKNVDPSTGVAGQVWAKVYLWQTGVTSNSNYYVTIENVINSKDPMSPLTLQVPVTMGGYIRQRLLVKVPGLKALYKFISFLALNGSASQGSPANYDRSRKAWVQGGSGGGNFTDFFTVSTKTVGGVAVYDSSKPVALKLPTAATSNVSCAACHLGAGMLEEFKDADTGETLVHTVDDPNGVFDSGGDGRPQDVGVTCEQCHGPGSQHRAEALKGVNPPTTTKGKKQVIVDYSAKYIVNPSLLCADRASLICGRCHSGGSPIDDVENWPPVGIGRTQYLTYLSSPTRGSRWPDNLHSRGGHEGEAYQDYLCSKHSHNQRIQVACDDCHDAMGDSTYRYGLKGDPEDPNSPLCMRCHAKDVNAHVTEKTGSVMAGAMMACRNCHMTRTGKGGAGAPGLILPGLITGLSSDANIIYWQNDMSSHVMDVPHKFSPGVAGTQPGLAMPVPYTHACGTCHDASKLQFQAPATQ